MSESFGWTALLTRRGVELIQRVVPREALSQIDSCNLIVIAPIYLQYLNLCLAIGGNVVVGVAAVWNWELR